MKKVMVVTALLLVSLAASSQEVLNMRTDFIPNKVDSNFFYYYTSFAYVVPKAGETTFQKSRLRADAQGGNRLTKGEMEMLLFPMMKYHKEFHPHVFLRLDVLTYGYLSSRFGLGVSSRSLNSSMGVFHGNYHRRVPYESNFITRRKRSFENYPLSGFYIQSSSEYASFLFSVAFERTHNFYSTRLSGKVGEILHFGEKGSPIRTSEVVMIHETLTGLGFGLSVSPFYRSRLEVLWIIPDREDVYEQARIQNKLSQGVMTSFSYFVE